MEIEFHYYITYLIATRAGFSPADAALVAHASQGVDDNHVPISVDEGGPHAYENVLSQTMDITRPHHDTRIYPVFHFIPGDPNAATAKRKDGGKSKWVTTPNGTLANQMIDAALASKDLYRIGASSHAYCDTWAHQNFLGISSDFNEMPPAPGDVLDELKVLNALAKIGHGPAEHKPDIVGLTWTDTRLDAGIATVINRVRFMDAAKHLFEKFYRFKHTSVDSQTMGNIRDSLIKDLYADIGGPDDHNLQVAQRLGRYQRRAMSEPYGGRQIPHYDPDAWANAALNQADGNVFSWLHNAVIKQAGDYGDLIREGVRAQCSWKNPTTYRQTDWYRFQEAIRTHLDECWAILLKSIPDAARQAS